MEVQVPAAHSGLDLSTSPPPNRCPTIVSGSNELAFRADTRTANRDLLRLNPYLHRIPPPSPAAVRHTVAVPETHTAPPMNRHPSLCHDAHPSRHLNAQISSCCGSSTRCMLKGNSTENSEPSKSLESSKSSELSSEPPKSCSEPSKSPEQSESSKSSECLPKSLPSLQSYPKSLLSHRSRPKSLSSHQSPTKCLSSLESPLSLPKPPELTTVAAIIDSPSTIIPDFPRPTATAKLAFADLVWPSGQPVPPCRLSLNSTALALFPFIGHKHTFNDATDRRGRERGQKQCEIWKAGPSGHTGWVLVVPNRSE
ncbi:hypothetical protein E1301_Tti008516 [Triplophysa tibetana]|uniref:Uncharacterized protein n=1 Tax=Triplophysa tibetana TaxID=1572043 RepID=A0A5A9P4Q9_9TELE|nr:hypothetical protein E1301_Tti008516 [Triplophysa tibetana]